MYYEVQYHFMRKSDVRSNVDVCSHTRTYTHRNKQTKKTNMRIWNTCTTRCQFHLYQFVGPIDPGNGLESSGSKPLAAPRWPWLLCGITGLHWINALQVIWHLYELMKNIDVNMCVWVAHSQTRIYIYVQKCHLGFYPRPVLAFGYCHRLRLCLCPCVCVCVYQSLACHHDNSSAVHARITKFGWETQNTLVKMLIIFRGDRPWPSRSNLTCKSNFTSFWACPHDNFSIV